jgi:hypothetical protein
MRLRESQFRPELAVTRIPAGHKDAIAWLRPGIHLEEDLDLTYKEHTDVERFS